MRRGERDERLGVDEVVRVTSGDGRGNAKLVPLAPECARTCSRSSLYVAIDDPEMTQCPAQLVSEAFARIVCPCPRGCRPELVDRRLEPAEVVEALAVWTLVDSGVQLEVDLVAAVSEVQKPALPTRDDVLARALRLAGRDP